MTRHGRLASAGPTAPVRSGVEQSTMAAAAPGPRSAPPADAANRADTFRSVGLVRVELTTSRLSGVRSNHLSYRPTSSAAPAAHCVALGCAHMRKGRDRRERGCVAASAVTRELRKEVIQPHLPVRLPCYDFTPLTRHTFGSAPLAVRQLTSGIPNSGGVTGGVYKARERIHRAMLIRDY